MKFGAGHWGTGLEGWFSGGTQQFPPCQLPTPTCAHILIPAKQPQLPSWTCPAHWTQPLAEHTFPYW